MRFKTPDLRPLLFCCLLILPGALWARCATDVVSVRGGFGQVNFTVEIADDPQERAIGLMHRQSMPRMSGMLFLYDTPQPLAFWMRNTLIPLDMLFIDPDGSIGHIHENAVPLDETAIEGGDGRIAVLEVNGGLSQRLGIKTGDVLRHPALDTATALWSCDE